LPVKPEYSPVAAIPVTTSTLTPARALHWRPQNSMSNQSLDRLLTRLETAKARFGPGEDTKTINLLARLTATKFPDAKSLLRFHEALLFLRAFPQGRAVIPIIEKLLNTFYRRIDELRQQDPDMSAFDDFDTSGVAGTTMQDTLTFEVVRWLARRIPRNVEIAWPDYWEDYQNERSVGSTLPRFIPLLAEDADVEANIPWTKWLEAAAGRGDRPSQWLIRQFEQLPVTERERAELYDSLRLPIRWRLENLPLSRTRNWIHPRTFFFHHEPLITRSQISLGKEFAKPGPQLERLSHREGEGVMHTIREVMAVRYRELYGTTLGDSDSVVRADLGRGVIMHFWNLPPVRRLPLRAYVAGFTLKNGVPINYIEAIGLCEWIEVGFNTFYTYRQGETAWVYAQALRCLHRLTGATTISVYPYQIGQNNDEAIDSGAFWFYRKLGFRSGRLDLEQLARREEQKIAADPRYKTPPRTLRRLAEAHVFCELHRVANGKGGALFLGLSPQRTGKGTTSSHAAEAAEANAALAAEAHPGPWDSFSSRNLGLRVNRRMAREFGGKSSDIRQAASREVSRILGANPSRWTPLEQRAFENWSLVLASIPDLRHWSPKEKADVLKIIRAQAARDEMRYLRLTQQHPRLRAELLHLGSTPDPRRQSRALDL
jgi:hypothetical protein